jgi:lipopolysaccharide/colanic/teichoic acid biosynthesis glycosyltransferase
VKRIFDLVLAGVGALICVPLFAVIATAIWLTDGHPVFFRQERVRRGGRSFRIWKFRTMVLDAERRGIQLTVGNDPRITPIGHWLRKTKLDELPQLFNVLAGEMSIVGPRPEVPDYVALYNDDQRRVLELTPGITDPASIKYFDEGLLLAKSNDPHRLYREELMPEKIRLNLEYAATANVWTDLMVVFKTIHRTTRSAT